VKCFRFLDNLIARVENIFIIILLTTMILLACLQIVLRNFFDTSIFWGDILLRHLVLWVGFIGASLATRENKHINIDVLSKQLSPGFKKLSQIIVNLFATLICYFLMRAGMTFIEMEAASKSILFSGLPTWVAQLIIALGFGIMMFRFFTHALEQILRFCFPVKEEPV